MRDVLQTNDPVLLSFVSSLLSEAGMPFHVADTHMSIVEGSIGILPRRILVRDADEAEARRLLRDAGLSIELRQDSKHTEDAPTLAPIGRRPIPDPA